MSAVETSSTRLPPGPRSAWIATTGLIRDPYGFHARCAARHGQPYTVPSLNGRVICSGRPAHVREIFAADPDCFAPWASATMRPLMGPGSIFQLRGEAHRRERSLLGPHFAGSRMRAYTDSMRTAALTHLSRLRPGEVFRAVELAQAISLDVILRTVLGCEDQDELARMRDAIRAFVARAHPLLFFAPVLQRAPLGLGPWGRFREARNAWDALVFARIAERRAALARGEQHQDILAGMLASRYEDGSSMPDEHVRDELVTLLFAGHETTALAIAWALYWLHREPAVLARARDELARPQGDAGTGPFLEAVCLESLRLNPIVPDSPRMVARELELFGVRVPAGVGVCWVSSLVHMDPDLHPEPARFRPERFLEGSFRPWEFLPFGGGARRCLGAAFALHEMQIVLATLLEASAFELAEPGEVRARRRSVTMGPATGVRLRLARRLDGGTGRG